VEEGMDDLERLADLVRRRNSVGEEICGIIDRPALVGHVGEFIAARIFGIALVSSASHKAIDGHFRDGSLGGRSVNIKWYGRQEGLLDITPKELPDFYLVLAGPRGAAESSRGEARPWAIESVFLFDAECLVAVLRERSLKLGVATSVRRELWREAEIFPRPMQPALVPTEEQRGLLSLFGLEYQKSMGED
jgi:Family of unknown function (DUF6998)